MVAFPFFTVSIKNSNFCSQITDPPLIKPALNIFILLLFFTLTATAQERKFLHLGLNEGLPQETVICITEDDQGFIWMGTSDGVVRFDGTNFYTPPEDILNDLDFGGLRIGAIQANKDNLLIGTGQKGLLRYNLISETTSSLGMLNENCTDITVEEGSFYAAYYEGGVLFVNEDFSTKKLIFDEPDPQQITSIAKFHNFIYLGTQTGTLFQFDQKLVDSNMPIPLTEIKSPVAEINEIVIIDDTIWIGTGDGLYQFESAKEVWNHFPLKECANMAQEPAVMDIVKSEDILFVGSREGLFELNISEELDCIAHYKADKKYDEKTINRDHIYDLEVYKNELLIGHNNLDVTSIKASDVFEMPTKAWNLGNPSVFAVYETSKYLFTGTTSGLVISEKNKPENFTIIRDFRIRGIIEDGFNNIWVINREGLFILPDQDFLNSPTNLVRVNHNPEISTSIASDNLRSIFKDDDGEIWILTFNAGINRFIGNVADRKFEFQRLAHGAATKKLPSPLTISMTEDGDTYWVTTQKGLTNLRFEGENYSSPVFKNYDERDGLITNGVLSSYIDKDGTLWVTSRKGLNKYIREEDRFVSYGKREGLSNTFVYNVLEDNFDNLWISTNGGLFRFNKQTETFSNYTPKDGVQSTEFNLGAAFKNKTNGHLYFGGINGLNVFDPSRIDELDEEGQLQLTAIHSKGEILSPNTSKILETNIATTKKLTLNYDEFPVNISFSAMDFRPTSNIQYTYKLLPEDSQWNALDDNNNIQLLTLSPQSYTLQIQGLSRGLSWSKPPLELIIVVKPPWYRSNLAYFSYLLLFLTAVYIYYKITVQRKLAGQEAQRLQDLDDLKSRFITNITHEFRTPLTIILGYVGTIKSTFKPKPELENSLNTIEQNSNNLLGLVNQMLDLAKLEQGRLTINLVQNDVVIFLKHITDSFSSLAEDKGVRLRFSSELNSLLMDFDPEKLRQIITNLLSNAIKFSDRDSEVSVSISAENNMAIIKVIDQGLGIPEAELEHVFDRFYQVDTSDFKVSQGTGIGLALTKELVLLLEGTVSASSEVGQGSIFSVNLPVHNDAPFSEVNLTNKQVSIGETAVPDLRSITLNDDANHVLIVEDNVDMARYITSCLNDRFIITHASNGQIGLDKAIAETPDLIVTDVMMPVMDGLEMTKELQSKEVTNHIPIVMLTSKAMQEDKMDGITSGADVYLTKPFSKTELQLRIEMLISKREKLQAKYQNGLLSETIISEEPIEDKNDIFLRKVISEIHKELDNGDFNSSSLASSLALSDSQLYRKLKAITNRSTAIFIRKIRLEKAKELLQKTEKTVSEIAYETGFNDPNWFGKAFKEEFGQAPSEVRL